MINLSLLYFANLITLFGSNILKIPMSYYLSKSFGIGGGFSFFIILQMIPSIAFAPIFSKAAARFSIHKTIMLSQIAALLMGALLLITLNLDLLVLSIIVLFILNTFGACLKILFPGLLKEESKESTELQKSLANWSIVSNLALVAAIMLGGLLKNQLSVIQFVVIDMITFGVSFILWRKVDLNSSAKMIKQQVFHFKRYLSFFKNSYNQVNFCRSLAYGVMNCFIPVIIVKTNNFSAEFLGMIYIAMGIISIVGSLSARKYTLKTNGSLATLLFLESLLIGLGIYFSAYQYYFGITAVLLVLTCFNQITLNTRFLHGQKKEDSAMASASFTMTSQMATLTSFVLYFIVEKHIPNYYFSIFAIICASACFTLIIKKSKNERLL